MARLSGYVSSFLAWRWLPPAVIVLALLLAAPALWVGLIGDDYMQLARVDARLHAPGFPYAPLDLFTFASGDSGQRAVLLDEGIFGWWMAPDFRWAFWRPLSSLTHLLDHTLWPRSRLLPHVQTLLWFAALLAVLAAVYRRFHAPWIAHLALLLYAVDDARAWVVGWSANRNALVAATLGFSALLLHDRARRDGWLPGAWLGPAFFAAALLGGESALGLTGYLFAYELFIDSGPLSRRLARLWPYAALSVAWLASYKLLGYGTSGGGHYLNPLDEPWGYLVALVQRLPILLAAQVGPSFSDAWMFLPPTAKVVGWMLALLVIALFGAVLAPLWRRTPECRFWALGTVLSLPPMCATFPMDRLLVFAGVGGMAMVAIVLAGWLEGGTLSLPRPRRVLAATVLPALAVLHLVLSPVLLPLRILLLAYVGVMGQRLEGAVPRDEGVREKTLVLLSSTAEMTTFPIWMQRQAEQVPRPRHMRVLASCFGDVYVSRVDERSLRVRPENGFLDNDSLRLVRGPSRPFHAGDEVQLSGLHVRVREVTPDGRPAVADFTFPVPLEDPSLMWRRIHAGGALDPWSPPAVGETQRLPAVEQRPASSAP